MMTGRVPSANALAGMGTVRAFALKHRGLAALIVALALCMKALLPVGYMVGTASGVTGKTITIEICDGQPDHQLAKVLVPLDRKGDPSQGKGSSDCPFSALSFGTMAVDDAAFVLAAILFVFALAFAPLAALPLPRLRFLNPPLRGPPALS